MISTTTHICFYLSDHGFGHISRNLPIVYKLLEYDNVRLTVVCGEKHIEFAKENLMVEQMNRVTFRPMHTDVGLIVKDGTLLVDEEKLEAETSVFLDTCPGRSRSEAEWLRDNHVDVAVCDMPIWSIEACRQAVVPLLYIGNFTWTELYREHLPESIWRRYAAEYRKLDHVLLYTLHNEEMLDFVGAARDLSETSVLCRPFHEDVAAEIRNGHQKPIIFVALGMSAKFTTAVDVGGLPYDFIVNAGVPLEGSNVEKLDWTVKNTQDYILASDYVISKAGWGTVAEILLSHKPVALFERDSVLEDRTTIRMLEEQGLAIKIEEDDLKNIPSIIRQLTELPKDGFDSYVDSSEQIAQKIMSLSNG